MSEKKVVSRTIAIALGIICLILVVGLVGAVVNYTSILNEKNSTIATKDSQITSLNSQISSLQNQKNQLQKWLDANKTAVISLTSQISQMNSKIIDLQSQLPGNQTLISQIQALTNQKDQLQTWLSGNVTSLNSQISYLQSQLSGNQTLIKSLNSKIIDLNDTINLTKSMVWINNQTVSQPESPAYTGWMFSASYAGYVSVNVQSSTTTTTYVEVVYSSYGVNYKNKIAVGGQGIAVFPVLPSNVEVRVGNTETFGATETVTITYYY